MARVGPRSGVRSRRPFNKSSYSNSRCGGTMLLISSLGLAFLLVVLLPLFANTSSSSWLTIGDSGEISISSSNSHFGSSSALLPITKQRTLPGLTPDGTFNGGPVYLQTKPLRELSSHVHCVGEKYQPDSWMERSCHFQMLCFNTTAHEYVVFHSEREFELARQVQQRESMHVSDMMSRLNETNAMSIGGINLKWGKKGIPRLKWFPKVVLADSNDMVTYYELPPATILIPFHSMNGANPGHLVWDDYLPMYTLLEMFQLNNDRQYDLLPIRYKLQDGERGLWASCDLRNEKTEACRHMMKKFFPLIAGVDSPYQFTTNEDAELKEYSNHQLGPAGSRPASSDLVCARNAVAGMGSLTDHGLHKAHGWEEVDYLRVHNHGRGGSLYEFRNFMLRNMKMDTSPIYTRPKPYRIVFSQKSSDIFIRSMDFERQIEIVKKNFPDAVVENYIFKEHTLQEQIEIATNAAIYVTLCGGGAVTGMFLPKGASVLIYYAEDGGLYNGKMNYKPALLDWDLFNSMSHLRVHWIPRNSRKTAIDENALIMLVRHELDLIESQAFAG